MILDRIIASIIGSVELTCVECSIYIIERFGQIMAPPAGAIGHTVDHRRPQIIYYSVANLVTEPTGCVIPR